MLLALEDLHWCDELSLDVITHLARRLRSRPMLVVGTVRTDELDPDLPVRAWRSRLLLQRMAEEVPLTRLTTEETARMVTELLPQRVASPALVELVQRRSGGVPLHVEELVKALVQGHLSADPSYVPETLADAVGQRFGVLSTPARDVAVAAAVVGRSFDLELIASVVEQPDLVVADSVDELVERQFFQAEAERMVRVPPRPDPGRHRPHRAARDPPRPACPGRGARAAPSRAGRGRLPVGAPRGRRPAGRGVVGGCCRRRTGQCTVGPPRGPRPAPPGDPLPARR